MFSRWQIQCKNTAQVTLGDVAKEVGLSYFLDKSVIVIATTGRIDDQIRKYIEVTERARRLVFILLDGQALARIGDNPARLVDEISVQTGLALCRVDRFSLLMMKRRPDAPTSTCTMGVAI